MPMPSALLAALTMCWAGFASARDESADPKARASLPVINQARMAPGSKLGEACEHYYPLSSRMAMESGATTLVVYIDVDGRASDTRIETGSGYVDLDQAAETCIVERGRFIPQTIDGVPVGSWQRMKITWNLETPARTDALDGLLAAYKSGDYQSLAKLLRPYANDGSLDSQVLLGRMYLYGTGVTKDAREAASWLQKAAERGSAAAQYEMGMLSEDGEGLPKDYVAAAAWFRKAAHQRHVGAAFSLALLYQSGLGVKRSDALALIWMDSAIAALATKSPDVVRVGYAELRDSLRARVAPGQLQDVLRNSSLDAPVTRGFFRDRAAVEKAARDVYPSHLPEHFGLRTVAMLAYTNLQGQIGDIRIETSSGISKLDAATLELVSKAGLLPRKEGENTVEAWQYVTWTWALR